ncbi:cytochrome c oxidase assembly protein [Aureimonas fodinaquatilis]|uniref:Cytochrome c oxidase assembly protein n=2 Tax=Aureimonas fodinaquatilis TaxID=2565783 RepID=A0A5B0DWY1_9HYPH|nr:cytochrome c oxidase assembly protein [Aureimonas fodinaquatilis]
MLAWNMDWVALALAGTILGANYFYGLGQRRFVVSATALIVVLFMSPLCALTAALFSARVVHHILLVAAVAPLLALAFPSGEKRWAVGIGWIAAIHAGIFWFWHAPGVYAYAVTQPLWYWTMQGSLLVSAVWLWRRVFSPLENPGAVALAMLATIVQMGMLGALLTFAGTPLYSQHFATTFSFGLTPLQDQQLAGLTMWVPAALPYLLAAVYRLWPLLGLPEEKEQPWSG